MGVQVKKMLIWLLRRWKWVLWVLAVLVSLGIFHGMCRGDQKLAATLTAQTAWQRWETEDKPYAQASVYLPEDSAISAAELPGIRLSMLLTRRWNTSAHSALVALLLGSNM